QDYLYLIRINTNEVERFVQVQQKFDQAWDLYDFQASHVEQLASGPDMLTQLMSLNIDVLLDTELDFDQRAQNEYPAYFEELSQQAQQIVEHTDNRAAIGIHQYSLALKSSYDSVLRNQNLLNTNYIFELFGRAHQEFIHLFDTLASGQRVGLSDDAKQTIDELSTYLQQDVDFVEAVQSSPDVTTSAPSQLNILDLSFVATQLAADKQDIDSEDAIRAFDNDVLDIFIEEADEILVSIDEDLNTWSENLNDTTALNNLMRHLHTLKGGANMVQAEYIGLIAHELETIYERIINEQLETTEPLVAAIRLVQDDIVDRMQIIREERTDYPASYTVALLQNIVHPQPDYVGMPSSVEVPVHLLHAETLPKDTSTSSTSNQEVVSTDSAASNEVLEFTTEPDLNGVVSSSTVGVPDNSVEGIAQEVFAEEAEELIDEAKVLLPQWAEQRSNRSLLLQLQRIAHSLKGGAKMVQMEQVADIAYELETAFEQFALHNFNSNAYDSLLESAFNWIKGAVLEENFQYFTSLKASLENIQYTDVSAQLPEKLTRSERLEDQYTVEIVQGDGTEPPSMMGELGADSNTEQNDEMIRISADLIEKMIDLSGENAINRSRIEMDLSQLGNTLTDMELAIQRLADQLRRMDGELESQIIAKHGDLNGRYEDFDPLEMDQYSSINQLSKSLAESASDLVDFKSTLVEKIKDTEGVLLQQSRIQAEISEGLMRARLVPFSRLLPRLQRLVRQVSTTLNKPTELLVNNTEGELDRTILEKLISPLEHMLRNALDHGIETTTERLGRKKPAQGKIDLDISRQGTDIVIEFKDDGRGIDAAKIRAKAIDAGLIKKDQTISDEDVIQYIFHPGFSTAEKVTQISGRGVGLDVVQSGIKSLGGQVSVASKVGQGSVFTIRVPTTVAVSDALMVKVGDQQFAVPLAQIDRIVRISPAALEGFFASNKDHFEIDNQSYKLRYLAEFVAHQPVPKLAGVAHSLPVLLIKGNMGNTIALLVDQLIGSRSQIVMKPIGEQFSSVAAISGATILGDGQVCLILDGQSIARQVLATNREEVKVEQRVHSRRNDQRQLVMIVDDSVTVRKVTTRLLERHGYDVVTAKDGVDAIEQLENVKPDLMLLDIEMPRMDGFEVTNLVRHHEVHRELPIIMITSRTGEKHRERAFSLGVNNYMGKPFQEANLLENITAALQASREA
ncbi:MAG: response regulator, partial [Acinetobacter sp.]|nr:response regulator [Acinetobacter sp.]